MRKVAASAAVFGVVLLAGLALAGEPVDWSKAFERRSDDFDWSRVTNRTTAPPRGPVDWSKAFGKKGQAQSEAQASAPPPAAPAPLEKPRAAAPPSLPTQTLQEPPPAPPAQPAGSPPAPAKPAPAPTPPPPPPAPAPAPAPPAAQAAPAPAADVSSPTAPPASPAQPAGSAPVPAKPAPAPAAPPPPPAPAPAPVPTVPPVPPAAQAAPALAVPASPAPELSLVLPPARPEPSTPTPVVGRDEPGKPEEVPAAPTVAAPVPANRPADATPPPAPLGVAAKPAQNIPVLPAPAPDPKTAPVEAPSRPVPAKKAPVQVAAVEQAKPGPLFPAAGYDDAQVGHFLAVALPEPDPKTPARPRMLTRWQGEVRLRVAGRNTAPAEALAREAAGEIAAALMGSRLSLHEAEPANLLVYVLPSGPGDAPGYVQNTYDAAAITGSKVVLYADRVSRGAALRLLLAALGLPGPAPAGQDSVFAAPRPGRDRLTTLDRTALQLLYSPVLAPGMDQASARQAVRSLRRSAP